MSDLHAVETEPEDWDGPVVELVEEDRVVGRAYLEDGVMLAEFFPDEDGETWAFEVADLQRVLDTAAAMLGLTDSEGDTTAVPQEHPVDRLATEFDAAASRRGAEDEGFYPVPVAGRMITACDALDLAMVNLEAFTVTHDDLVPVPGHAIAIGDAHAGEPWPTFIAGCNVQAQAVLERWISRGDLLVAVEVADRDGDRYVL